MSGGISVTDAAYRNVSPTSTGFYIWRIEKFELVPIPRDTYGKFFNGDSYIVLSCTINGETGGLDTKIRPTSGNRLEQHIHFWLGEDSSSDEAAVAAYKTVELDDYLAGAAIQHREVQGHESARFLAYFKGGIRILQGGVATGLSHMVEDQSPKLYIVKGKRQPIVRQTATVSWAEMNEGDVFVLDARDNIFVWMGKHSNRLERLQASKLANKIKEENGGGNVVIVDDGNEQALPHSELADFEQFLPMAQKKVRAATEADSDEKEDARTRKEIKLYRCTDEDGTLKVSEVKTGPLLQSDLDSKDSFIIDNGDSCGIWVWVGKKASAKERTEAMRNAQGFIKKKGYKAHTPVTRVVDGGEPSEFKSLFKGWREKDQVVGIGKKYTGNRGVAKVVQAKFDAKTLHENPKMAAETRMVDDGKGAKEVFRVDHFDLLQVAEGDEGKFYSGDCYVVLYAYSTGSRDNYLIYYWLGSHSSQDEQGTAALKAVELDQRLGGSPVQVRVVQGKEPPHFLAIFQGKLTIFQGGLASAFDGHRGNNVSQGSTYLLQVHGRTELATKAVQVDLTASSLNSNDCFVLVSPRETYVWLGKGSTGDEKEMAKNVAKKTDRDPEIVYEGQEKNIFWELLGGKSAYSSERINKDNDHDHPVRLFHGSNATGNFRLVEILNFSQVDLVEDDVMLLDIGDAIFVWLGADSNAAEGKACIESAHEYLDTDPSGRDGDCPIMIVKQGYEPANFTGLFGAWDNKLFKKTASAPIQQSNGTNHVVVVDKRNGAETKIRYYDVRTLRDPEKLPVDVDPSRKELHLSDQDFREVFKMSKDAFEEQAEWKRVAQKKQAGLF